MNAGAHDDVAGDAEKPGSETAMERAWVGLGGNFAQSEDLIELALKRLDEHELITVLRRSAVYRSPPWGHSEQAEFANAVCEIETSLAAEALLNHLLNLEISLGRERSGVRWGPRCIDLDLLTFGEQEQETERLVLPHPRMHLRAFVLKPILDLEPAFEIPGIGSARLAMEKLDPGEIRAVRPVSPPEQETYK